MFNTIAGMDNEGNPTFNKYINIKDITIGEGIEVIEDGGSSEDEVPVGTFLAIGMGISYDNYRFNETLPNSLTKIGGFSFYLSSLNLINIPASVESIESHAFLKFKILKL